MLRRLAAPIALFALAGTGLWLAIILRQQGLEKATTWLNIISVFLAFAAVVVPAGRPMLYWFRHGGKHPAGITIDEATEALSKALSTQWAREEERRRVNDPQPLPVRWAVTPAAEAAMVGVNWHDVGSGSRPVEPEALAAEYHDILDVFIHRLPSRRLIMLGQAGAGKSVLALKLARDLLAARKLGDLVPVMLPIAAWNQTEDFYSWVAQQLLRDHPGLDGLLFSAVGGPMSLATAIATTNRLLLILDGFDELSEPSRQNALTRINRLGAAMPLVITSRTAEYQQAVSGVGRGLARAAAIELAPMGVAAIKAYLTKATAAVPVGRWDRVFAHLDQPTPGPIAEALQTPLMVWLARTIYEGPATAPSELTDTTRFADRTAVEHHLLDELIAAIYGYNVGQNGQRKRWSADQASSWLQFLARWLQRRQTNDLAWWHLSTALPRVFLSVTLGLAVGLVLIPAAALVIGPLIGLTMGLTVGVLLGVQGALRELSPPTGKSRVKSGPPSWLLRSTSRTTIGRAAAIAVGLAVGLQQALTTGPAVGVAYGATAGLVAGLVVGFLIHEGRSLPSRVEFRIRENRRLFVRRLMGGVLLGLGFGLVLGLTSGIVLGLRIGSLLGLLAMAVGLALGLLDSLNIWIDAPADVTRAVSPSSVLKSDRTAAFVRGGVVGMVVAIGTGLATAPAFGVVGCLLWGLELGLAFGVVDRIAGVTATAWSTFAVARVWLAMTNRLPWRLMAFLDDAHQCGVLRQVGAVYQFRHVRLQERLTSGSGHQPR